MRFVIDGMLGKLARWLRLLGYDVDYSNNYSDETLIERACQQRSVLITADESLFKTALSRRIESMLIKEGGQPEKIAQVVERYKLDPKFSPERSRCPKCGSTLRAEAKANLEGRVPSKSYQKYDQFWICSNPGCNKIYWQGSHWDNIQKTLNTVRNLLRN